MARSGQATSRSCRSALTTWPRISVPRRRRDLRMSPAGRTSPSVERTGRCRASRVYAVGGLSVLGSIKADAIVKSSTNLQNSVSLNSRMLAYAATIRSARTRAWRSPLRCVILISGMVHRLPRGQPSVPGSELQVERPYTTNCAQCQRHGGHGCIACSTLMHRCSRDLILFPVELTHNLYKTLYVRPSATDVRNVPGAEVPEALWAQARGSGFAAQ
jgi:hypothetical protein